MTPARQQRKSATAAWGAAWRLGLALVLAQPVLPAGAGVTERVVVDPQSGLAMNGFDPVSYFTDGAPQFGRPDQEARQEGVIWRFRNEGNKAAFMAHPEVYMPRYGGYDPIGLGRGVAVPGNPLVWAMVDERLYFFFNEAARAHFIADPKEAILHADHKWPTVAGGLNP